VAFVAALVPFLAACAPEPAEQDFLDTYGELVLEQDGYPDGQAALDAGRVSCHVMAREDDAEEAFDAATRSVVDRLDTDEFLSGLVVALAAQTLCPEHAPAGLFG
jgi:hypothetical protein